MVFAKGKCTNTSSVPVHPFEENNFIFTCIFILLNDRNCKRRANSFNDASEKYMQSSLLTVKFLPDRPTLVFILVALLCS